MKPQFFSELMSRYHLCYSFVVCRCPHNRDDVIWNGIVCALPGRIISIISALFSDANIIEMIRSKTATCLRFRRMRPYEEETETAVFVCTAESLSSLLFHCCLPMPT